MSIRGRIINAKPTLSEAENKIADFILEQPEKVINMTASMLASSADSSPASVIRLSKKLDIGSFTRLKILLSSDLTNDKTAPKDYEDITNNEDIKSIQEKLLSSALQSLRETTDQVNEDEVLPLVEKIKDAKQLLLFGSGASFLSAQNIAQKWNRIGKSAIADNDLNDLLPKIVNAQKGDIIWIISNSGESPEAILAAKVAKESGVFIVSLTRFGNNKLATLSDIAVHTSQPRESTNRIAATNSLLAQFMIIDIIFYFFVSKTFTKSANKLKESSNKVHEYKKRFLN